MSIISSLNTIICPVCAQRDCELGLNASERNAEVAILGVVFNW